MENTHQPEILYMLKALADHSRLTMLRILSEGESSVGDLARQVDLGEPTVSHHLARLREAGLVTLRMAGNQRFYRLNPNGLSRFKRLAEEIEQMPSPSLPEETDESWIEALNWSLEDKQVLREHTRGRQIISLPAKRKKLFAILRWLSSLFEPNRLYSEKEVNEVLKTVYEHDYISLRRDLVDVGYLQRERGGEKYWLASASPEVSQ